MPSQRAAIAQILQHAERGYDPEICAVAGMPGAEATRELITRESA